MNGDLCKYNSHVSTRVYVYVWMDSLTIEATLASCEFISTHWMGGINWMDVSGGLDQVVGAS